MPAKSKAQFKKVFVLERQGKMTKKQVGDFTHGVNYKKLPDRVKKKKRPVRRPKQPARPNYGY